MTREMVLGVEVVLADGTILSSLSRTIKNNAGYDLKHLFIGSEGTLGVVTRAVLRLHPAFLGTNVALVAVQEFEDIVALRDFLEMRLYGALSSFEVMWRDYFICATSGQTRPHIFSPESQYYILLETQGFDQESSYHILSAALEEALTSGIISDAILAKSEAERAEIWAIREAVEAVYRLGEPINFDVSLSVSDMHPYTEGVRRKLKERWPDSHCLIFGHLGDGNLHISVITPDPVAQTRTFVEETVYRPLTAIGGSISGEHGVGLEKRQHLAISRSMTEIEIMKRLKACLDPQGILNNGKIFEN